MRRRITLAILGTVAAALLLAGLGTLALTRVGARSAARRDLDAQAEASAAILEIRNLPQRDPQTGQRFTPKERLTQVRDALKLEDVSLVVLGADGQPRLDLGDPIPDGVTLTDAQLTALRDGQVVSGSHGSSLYSVVPYGRTGVFQPVLILTRNVGPTLGSGVGWFALASVLTLLLGALVADRLSRRLTRPLADATETTARIAEGDLSVRVPGHLTGRPGARDELDALAHSINEMADSLARSRGLEQQFLLSVSHDLRTPLTSIQGYAEAIADGAVPDDRAAAGVILTESRRLDRLVRDLLDLAKLEARQFSLDSAPVDVAGLVSASVEGFRPEVEAAGLRLVAPPPTGAVVALADRDRLAQVVANLLENALKFASSTVTVAVDADPDGAGARIEVADDGPGIRPEDLPHVFERLYVAAHEPVRKEVGSGLGLAIVRELVEAMGGSVRAEAAPTGGARMVVSLPAATPPPPPPPPPRPPAPAPPAEPRPTDPT